MSASAAPPDRSTLPNTAAAVLGMIALGARSGYEIRRAAELSVRFFWALGPPQVYAQLKALEAGGLIAGRDEARGGRPRRHFSLTDEGHEALRSWVTDPAEAGAMELRDPELLRLFFADAVDHDAARGRIDRIRRRSHEAIATFDRDILPAAADASQAGSHFPGHVARFGRELHEFIAAWCDRVEETLEADGHRQGRD